MPEPQAPLTLENHAMRLTLLPHYGARIVSLVDRRSGRDWMAPGGQSPNTGEAAVYSADEAVGWDECFPTVSVWDAQGTAWGRRLRDHGDLWGRPWAVADSTGTAVTTRYGGAEFVFERRLRLDGSTLHCDYRVDNIGRSALPFMWALHGLLAVTPADQLLLPGVETVEAAYVSSSRAAGRRTIGWPGPSADMPIAFDRVLPATSHLAAKLYAAARGDPVASIGNAGGWLDMRWDIGELPAIGLWFNYGGWPTPGEGHQLAVEATTAPADHLGQAIATGAARQLAPGGTATWAVQFALRH